MATQRGAYSPWAENIQSGQLMGGALRQRGEDRTRFSRMVPGRKVCQRVSVGGTQARSDVRIHGPKQAMLGYALPR
jgi:hypothetical protein